MKKTIPVIGMACSVCSANVEKKLQSLEGINSASVSLASRTALVDYDPDIISPEDMKREISNAGYDLVIENDRSVEEINRREFTLLRRRTLASWLFAILTMCFSMGWISLGMEQNMISDGVASAHHSSSFANRICLLLALANLLYCGKQFYVSAWKQLLHHTANMDSLVALSTLIAFLFSTFNTFFGEMVWGSERHRMAHLFRCFRNDYHLRADRQMPGRKGEGQYGEQHPKTDGNAAENCPTGDLREDRRHTTTTRWRKFRFPLFR